MQSITILIIPLYLAFRRPLACSRIQCAQKVLLQKKAGSRRGRKLSHFYGFQIALMIDWKGISRVIGNQGGRLQQRRL